ncbi:helix-turn-helix transcriptional regulator [Clostridium beijerinckii]|uniref:helix-turn-helix domain-containing protein n=1 Tax=Clostridium beijerinckii TaxID=1520 RepID=UPI0022261FBA|nr:helix-turn-helix transcriptional regulator [Clostridium beijerinckii]UYZ36759.1 helix-turn-helix transcriptional regulator [Clostridium beijerinckii]
MGLEIINVLKKEKALTTEQLSNESGVPIGTLNKILNGTTKDPKLETLKAIARVLNCSLDDFDDVTIKKNKFDQYTNLSKEEIMLLENYNKLSALGKDKLIEYSNDLTETPKYIENVKNKINTNIEDEFTIAKKKSLEARINAEQRFKESPDSLPKASHDKHGSFTDEEYKHDDDIMNDDDFWNK